MEIIKADKKQYHELFKFGIRRLEIYLNRKRENYFNESN